MTFSNIVLVITATATALIAGLFYSWSCSVVPGLTRLPDKEYLMAFQSMNRAILNPVFFFSFLGTAVLLPLSVILQYNSAAPTRFWLLAVAAGVYLIGGLGLTIAGNVPLNEALDAFNIAAASEESMAAQRKAIEQKWNTLNIIRTFACTISCILVIIACLVHTSQSSE